MWLPWSTQVIEPGTGAVVPNAQRDEFQSSAVPLPLVVTRMASVIEAPGATLIVPVEPSSVVVAWTVAAAATYGPTNGPPAPGTPSGWTALVPRSRTARARSRRPLPVSALVPAGAADRASRPTMVPFEASGSIARSKAAAAETSAAEADVPVTLVVPPPARRVVMFVPGAPRKAAAPRFEVAMQ